jgi:peroxiredoxin Q/BCP
MGKSSLAGVMWPSAEVIPDGRTPEEFEAHGGIRYRNSADPRRTPELDVPRRSRGAGVDPLAIRLATLHQAPVLSSKMAFPLPGMVGLSPCAVGPRDDMVKSGDAAPDFAVTAPDGRVLRLSDLRGRPVVLFMIRILSTSLFCPLCVPGLEQLDDLAEEFRALGAEILVVGASTAERCEEFAEALGLRYPIYADPNWVSFKAFGAGRLGSLPLHAWALVDGEGIVQWVWRMNGPDENPALPMPSYVLDQFDEIFSGHAR